MQKPRKSQVGLGAILFLAGLVLEAAAVAAFFLPHTAELLPFNPLAAHLYASALIATGGAAIATASLPANQLFGPFILFTLLSALLPAIGTIAVACLTATLAWHCWHKVPVKVPLERVAPPDAPPSTPSPLNQPLVGLRGTLPDEDLQTAILGMAEMPPRETRPILKSLQKHRDVRVLLYANGLLNDHLNTFEKRLAVLQNRAKENPLDVDTLTALLETYASLIEHNLIPPDEIPTTAKRALKTAATALQLDASNQSVLTIQARFQILIKEFAAAYTTIQHLYTLPHSFDASRTLHAELLFEHAATRPVRTDQGSTANHRMSRHRSLN